MLTDITVVNDGDAVAAGYSAITHTLDDGMSETSDQYFTNLDVIMSFNLKICQT